MNRLISTALTLLVALSTLPPARAAADRQGERFALAAKYQKNTLLDVSADGSLILLYGMSTPRRRTSSKGVTEWRPKSGDEYHDILRVVEWASGRELGSLHVHSAPLAARFVGDPGQVCYVVPEPKDGGQGWEKKRVSWDYVSGRTGDCARDPAKGSYLRFDKVYDSPDGKFRAETFKETTREFLTLTYVRGVVRISDRSRGESLGEVRHPTVREPYDWPLAGLVYSVAITPDCRYVMTSYEGDTYVWRNRLTPD